MSNVAIKLIAITGVVGLGLLMFLQAQKGMQSGEMEKQLSQYESLNADDSQQTSPAVADPLTVVPNQLDRAKETTNIPFNQVPGKLTELATRIAAPIKKAADTPFTPNRTPANPKIRLTAGTKESTSEAPEAFANPELVVKKDLDARVKGLDFRTTPETKAPSFSGNPFSDSEITPTANTKFPAIAQTEFKTGPQFGTPNQSDPDRFVNTPKTTVPPRETIKSKTESENPFASKTTGPPKTELLPEPDQIAFNDGPTQPIRNSQLETNSPAPKIDSTDSPFENQKENSPNTPSIGENPFQTTPEKSDTTNKPALPTPQTPTPVIEEEFNPFKSEPAVKPSSTVETPSATAKPLPIITGNNEKYSASPSAEPVKPIANPFPSTNQKKPIQQPLSPDDSADVVVIKKRKADPSPKAPSLFSINGQSDKSGKTTPQPIEISPTPEPKPLSLVEGEEPALKAPVKLALQQNIQSPKMTIQKMAPPEAVLGQPFIYHVLVKNTGTTSAQEVVVEDRIPKGAKLTGTIPRAEQMKDRIIWRLGEMDPGTEKKISIRVIPEESGQIGSVATVNFVTKVASETKITAPQLTLKTDQPSAVNPGEIAVLNFSITNSGTGEAKNVYLRSIIPPQFSHPGGDDLEYSVGVIPAGKTTEVQLQLKAIKPGAGKSISSVTGDGNLKVAKEIPLKVIGTSEQFLLTRKGPKSRHLGQSGSYENVINNNSEKSIQNISVFESVPKGMKFVSASANGQFDTVRNVVQWDIPELASGDRQVLSIELEPIEVGKMVSTVQVVTDNSTKQSANLQSETTVIGQPLLKVETSELKGPLEIGEKMTMQMQLMNQGSASATNVEFRVKIPQELVFLSAKGPVRYQQVGSYIIFAPTQELPAKQALNFEISLSAKNKGDARVLVQVQSKQMEKPLSQEEAISVLDKL